ncbi:apolipoprotein N-acyltransferase [Fastidiosibacter lacustris]|uniref:apolipoprotein N-acyltransferase n=1 Tax=Fastidiosibacter lacustris TaxID=2056695 RepID=UPI000E348830|nr:apolipoprotein N-acyltransferase [Fastidiosibacter lacustris]
MRLFLINFSALLCGAILTLSFSPIGIASLAFVSLVGFFYLIAQEKTIKKQLWLGYCYGVGFFSTSISWVYVSIYAFSQSIFLSISLTTIFILFLSTFFLIFGYCFGKLNNKHLSYRLLILPVCWFLLELLRTYLFTGFPWVLLGYSQTHTIFSAFAPVGSVFLVGFIVCFMSLCLTEILLNLRHFKTVISMLLLITLCFISALGFRQIKWTHSDGIDKTVTIIQGNYIQDQKWDPSMLQTIIDHYYKITRNNPADLVFWPENAIPTFKPFIEPFLAQINDLGKNQESAILVGTVALNHKDQYFNSAFVYGLGSGYYHKRHLVPFGEYYPFSYFLEPFMAYFNIPMSSFTKGAKVQPLLNMNGVSIALFICYEIAYPSEVRAQLQNADLITVISDDAWFGDSLAPWQHEEISQMRAIETGRFVIQATNNGVTSIINPKGQTIVSLPRNKQAVLKGNIEAIQGNTPWMKYGLLPILFLSLLFIVITLFIGLKNTIFTSTKI